MNELHRHAYMHTALTILFIEKPILWKKEDSFAHDICVGLVLSLPGNCAIDWNKWGKNFLASYWLKSFIAGVFLSKAVGALYPKAYKNPPDIRNDVVIPMFSLGLGCVVIKAVSGWRHLRCLVVGWVKLWPQVHFVFILLSRFYLRGFMWS